MYSAVEVADFVIDRHLYHGCVVEQCIHIKKFGAVLDHRLTRGEMDWKRTMHIPYSGKFSRVAIFADVGF